MLLEKHKLFETDEDRAELARIRASYDSFISDLDESKDGKRIVAGSGPEWAELRRNIIDKATEVLDIEERLRDEIEDRYIASLQNDKDTIIAEIKEILGAITKEDYIDWQTKRAQDGITKAFKNPYRRGYKTCFLFLRLAVRVQGNALFRAGLDSSIADELASQRAQDFGYKKPTEKAGAVTLDPNTLEGFYLLAQSHASNKLAKRMTTRLGDSKQLDLYGNGNITEKDFKLFIKGYAKASGVKQSAAMLLDSLMITATKDGLNDTLVTLPLKEYMKMRGLSDEKETRRQVKEDIDALERISFEYKGTGKQKGAWLKVSISGGTVGQVKNGDIVFRFNQDFFNSFKLGNNYLYMYFPRAGLQGNARKNPWKYWLARKISEHKRMNIGRPNENTISVQTLIDACPNYPTYEEVMQGDRAITRRIVEPFERDLDELRPDITWEYKGLDESPKTYQEFINAQISIHWAEYPNTANLEAGKKKRAQRVQASKKKPQKGE